MAKYVMGLDTAVTHPYVRLLWGTVTELADVGAGAESAGVSEAVARAAHAHHVTVGVTPATMGTTNTEGSSSGLARGDHVHAKYHDLSSIAGTGLTNGGTEQAPALSVAYALVAAITTVEAGDTGSAGVANTASRGDHQHAVSTATVSDIASVSSSKSAGVSTTLARGDHVRDVANDTIGENQLNLGSTSGSQVDSTSIPAAAATPPPTTRPRASSILTALSRSLLT